MNAMNPYVRTNLKVPTTISAVAAFLIAVGPGFAAEYLQMGKGDDEDRVLDALSLLILVGGAGFGLLLAFLTTALHLLVHAIPDRGPGDPNG